MSSYSLNNETDIPLETYTSLNSIDNINNTNNTNNINIKEHLEENHAGPKAKYIKNIVYGGLDGIITTFSIIAAAVGASLDMKIIITMGVANLIADGISMGLGDYLSSTFENKYIISEKNKEEYEYIHNKDYEIAELIELYEQEGLEKDDAKSIVNVLSKEKYKEIFLKHMINLELGLDLPDGNPIHEGTVTFCSFITFGFIPVLFYIIFYASGLDYDTSFIITCFISAITMFLLGFTQAIITKQSKVKGALIMMGNGVLASMCAFFIGYGLERGMN